MKTLPFFLLILLGISGCTDSFRSTTDTTLKIDDPHVAVEPDNSAVNQQDQLKGEKTPIDQNENATDIGITADIRKRIVDTDMSVNAHNVKIITQDGTVTLRGAVKSAEEKNEIETIAGEVAGDGRVVSQLQVE